MDSILPEEEQKRIKQAKMDFCMTFGSESGERVLKYLENSCFKYDSTYTPGITTEQILINEGQRRVLLTIENMVRLSDEDLIKMKEGGSI
jgi:hypothetical protein